MKNLIYLFVFTILASSVFAQGIIEREYSHYVDQEDVTHVFVSGIFFDFASIIASGVEDKEGQELLEFASKIESFSFIKVPKSTSAKSEFENGIASLGSDYSELMRVREDKTQFVIFVDEENDIVFEVVGLGVVDGEFIALSLVGEIDLNKIAKFISHTDSEMLSPLKRLSDLKLNDLKVYPSPTRAGTEINIEVPEGMIGGKVTLYSSNGNLMKTMDINTSKEQLNTSGLSSGNYFIEFKKESVVMKKQVIILK